MSPGARTALTLGVLALLLVGGAWWGFSALTEPIPSTASSAECETESIAAGDKIHPRQVVVSVLNAGSREGLASLTQESFLDQGFRAGDLGNTDRDVPRAEIWTTEPDSPAVRLVRSWLGKRTEVVEQLVDQEGVVVVVGNDFEELSDGRRGVKVEADTEVCVPPRGTE